MNRTKKFLSGITTMLVVVIVYAPSVFGESRHQNETNRERVRARLDRAESRRESQRSDARRDSQRSDARREDRSPRSSDRTWVDRTRERERTQDRGRIESRERERSREFDRQRERNADRDRGRIESRERERRRDVDRDRRDDRNDGWRRNDGRYRGRDDRRDSYRDRRPHYSHGRISDVRRYGNGYRVWIAGVHHPFFVPHAYYHRGRFRVGLSIRIGGYWNPLGYYDYDDGYYDDYYRGSRFGSGTLRGVVEDVDYRRGTLVVRNDATGSFVTVLITARERVNVRRGDYVELEGDWTRYGDFRAYDIDFLDYRR